MSALNNKKPKKRKTTKIIAGIKLPPIEPTDEPIKTITDVDPSFYSLVESRPIRPNTSILKYKQHIKEVALKRTIHGFLTDEILRITKEIAMERKIYESASKDFEEYKKSFDKFLAHDNNQTIDVMKKSDSLAKDLANETEEYKKVNFEMATLKSKLLYIDETLSIMRSFQNFLYKSSPILWLQQNNIVIEENHSEIVSINSDIFSKINVDLVKEKLSQFNSPQLYFEKPDQLLSYFSLLEKQNLNYLLVTEELNCEKNKFLRARDCLKMLLKQELAYIEEKIQEIEDIIALNLAREEEVKSMFYDILEDKIKFLVSSELVLQIFNYVEFTYEQLIAPNDTKLSSLEMVLALDNEFEILQLDISAYDLNIIKEVEKETYETGENEIKQAIEAAKLLKNVDKLSRRLKSSYEPSRKTNNLS